MKVNTINHLINTLPMLLKTPTKFLMTQESAPSLEYSRFIQDTAVNLAPKALFARSKVDLAENSFLEISESLIVYYGPKILGENVFRKLYTKNLTKSLQQQISTPFKDLKSKPLSKNDLNSLKTTKAAIALSCLIIPFSEFSLSYIKNLFTLKVFKQADFNNIANLNKDKKEDGAKQKLVKQNAKKNIKYAGLGAIGAVLTSILLLKKGKTSTTLQNFSELILTPGDKLISKNKKLAAFINKYFSLDFSDKNGKLALSKGQLTTCVLLGGAGYLGAAKDRGKENFKETLFRFPLVGFYVISGSELFEKAFKKILGNFKSYKPIIKNGVPKFTELASLAQELAQKNSSQIEKEFKTLCKQKLIISSVPFAFSIAVMGGFVIAMSNAFTKYRYQKDISKKTNQNKFAFTRNPFKN